MTTIQKTLKGLWSLIVGLKVTGKEFCRPWITVHYPRQEVSNLDSYRGHIDLVPFPEDPRKPLCIVCRRCEEVCPSGCIRIEGHVPGEEKENPARRLLLISDVPLPGSAAREPVCSADKTLRVLDGFSLNYNLCSLCGLCVQSCPVSSLTFSGDVYLAGRSRKDFEYDLLQRLRMRADSANLREAV
ncbi:MAG: 4Fe-4S dicluster domain-containing protein [Desulfobacteraceae bacterium]|nr:MAG: 4Fe-4S dicluster domain-containing protein [Desulfobacteraceae bacterium]